ncbi:MAG: ArsR/SmtB family transcription factor [Candidatus Heimdallarchaeota archaeon]
MLRHSRKIDPKIARLLAHDLRWQIMMLLSDDETNYAKRISEELNISESKVHYHMAKLREAGLIIPIGIKPGKRRGRAKLFKPVAAEYYLSLDSRKRRGPADTVFDKIFAGRFVTNEEFDARIIVGSAEAHGRYDAISRDGYLVSELCGYLGCHLTRWRRDNQLFPYFLCTDVDYEKHHQKERTNLIILGGHITNTLTAEYNSTLENKFGICFVENRIMVGKTAYANPENGLIALFRRPDSKRHWVLILAGVRGIGTKATLFALTSDCIKVLEDAPEFVSVIKGQSRNGRMVSGVEKLDSRINSHGSELNY